jgi:NADH-quinone oxidoreductase subunit K
MQLIEPFFSFFFYDINIFIYCIIFVLGFIGIVTNNKNLIMILICVEIILCSINLLFIYSSFLIDDILGQIFVLVVLTVAASEASIVLAIIILTFRLKGNIFIKDLCLIKG